MKKRLMLLWTYARPFVTVTRLVILYVLAACSYGILHPKSPLWVKAVLLIVACAYASVLGFDIALKIRTFNNYWFWKKIQDNLDAEVERLGGPGKAPAFTLAIMPAPSPDGLMEQGPIPKQKEKYIN